MPTTPRIVAALVLTLALAPAPPAASVPAHGAVQLGAALEAAAGASAPRMEGSWTWPVVGPVVRDFDPPEQPYGAGHRGIDIAAAFDTPVHAPEAGVVSFAGKVGGELYVTIDHGGGLLSTCSWLSAIAVRKGDRVVRGQRIGATGRGHPDATVPHLHFGVRLNGVYVDPLRLLGPAPVSDLIHLAPELGTA
jgi:murein DD-endopeptidase MepM/ murein hydrolase activator NlpD